MAFETQKTLPLIDFSKGNLDPSTSNWDLARDKVRRALEDYGCFVARYDEISSKLHEEMLEAVKDVYDVLTTKKGPYADTSSLANWFRRSDPNRPTLEGFSIKNVIDYDEIKSLAQVLWPSGNEAFCDTMLAYAKLLLRLEQMVVKMIFESYGLKKYFDSQVDSMTHQIGTLKYGATNNSALGFRPHTDKCFIVILDSNYVNGLEVQTKDGEWIAYEKTCSHFVVMAGDAFLAWSNGRIHSPIHRVIYGGDEARYTIKLDSYAHDLVVTPQELVDDEHPLLFKPFSNFGFVEYCKTMIKDDVNHLKSYCGT